jgi:hypothetical protein
VNGARAQSRRCAMVPRESVFVVYLMPIIARCKWQGQLEVVGSGPLAI